LRRATQHRVFQFITFVGFQEAHLGVKKSGKGRRKLGRKKRRMRAKIRHRKK
jgi:hypothetical protein